MTKLKLKRKLWNLLENKLSNSEIQEVMKLINNLKGLKNE